MSQVQQLYGILDMKHQEEESWEVRAFAGDTGTATGAMWPPRSYACSFCRSEFQSAQALGGHMNVHRRHHARLCQHPAEPSASPAAPMILSSSDVQLCFFYPTPLMALLGKVGMVTDDHDGSDGSSGVGSDGGGLDEELDLELRLGW